MKYLSKSGFRAEGGMTNKASGDTPHSADSERSAAQFLPFGKERSEAMLNMQKELLGAYREVAQAWVSRVKSELEFWSDLSTKLAASRSVPEGMEAYRNGIAQRMQMVAEDGKRMLEDGQKLIANVTAKLSNGLSVKSE
jgi:hypothetical protein